MPLVHMQHLIPVLRCYALTHDNIDELWQRLNANLEALVQLVGREIIYKANQTLAQNKVLFYELLQASKFSKMTVIAPKHHDIVLSHIAAGCGWNFAVDEKDGARSPEYCEQLKALASISKIMKVSYCVQRSSRYDIHHRRNTRGYHR